MECISLLIFEDIYKDKKRKLYLNIKYINKVLIELIIGSLIICWWLEKKFGY